MSVILERFVSALSLSWCCLVCLSSASCVPESPQRDRRSTGDPHAPLRQPPALDLVAESAWPAPYASDALWRRASTGDDIDLARLAQRESALGLMMALGHGGSLGRTALQALQHTRDRRDARAQLCELVPGPNAATSSLLLAALHEAVVGSPVTEESIDAAADARCARTLRELMLGGALSATDGDRVAGTITRLEAR